MLGLLEATTEQISYIFMKSIFREKQLSKKSNFEERLIGLLVRNLSDFGAEKRLI